MRRNNHHPVASLPESEIPPVRHHRVPEIVRMRDVGHGRGIGSARGRTHVGQDDPATLRLQTGGDGGEFGVGLVDAPVGQLHLIQDERAHDDSGIGAPLKQVFDEEAHTVADRVAAVGSHGRGQGANLCRVFHVVVLYAVVGADVEEDDIWQGCGYGGLSLGQDLVDPVPGPPFDGIVGHSTVVAAADVSDICVATSFNEGSKVLAVAISVGGEEAIRDGRAEGHDAEGSIVGQDVSTGRVDNWRRARNCTNTGCLAVIEGQRNRNGLRMELGLAYGFCETAGLVRLANLPGTRTTKVEMTAASPMIFILRDQCFGLKRDSLEGNTDVMTRCFSS